MVKCFYFSVNKKIKNLQIKADTKRAVLIVTEIVIILVKKSVKSKIIPSDLVYIFNRIDIKTLINNFKLRFVFFFFQV